MALEAINTYCKVLRLPTVAQVVEEALRTAQREDWSLETFLQHLLEQELAGRRERRITRLTKAAHFPPGKTLETFDQKRLPLRIRRQIPQLCAGACIARAENILIFGLPGTGKTHLATALGYEWVQRNYSVLFIPTFKLVGGLLRAKRDYPRHSPNGLALGRANWSASCAAWTVSKSLSWMIWDTSNKAERKWKSSSLFWPNGMNAAASLSPPIWYSRNGIRSSKTP